MKKALVLQQIFRSNGEHHTRFLENGLGNKVVCDSDGHQTCGSWHGGLNVKRERFSSPVWTIHMIICILLKIFILQQKCKQYWPEKVNEEQTHGEICLSYLKETLLPDYIVRSFKLTWVSSFTCNLCLRAQQEHRKCRRVNCSDRHLFCNWVS